MIGQMGVRRAARGSGVSSLVNHLLGALQSHISESSLLYLMFFSIDSRKLEICKRTYYTLHLCYFQFANQPELSNTMSGTIFSQTYLKS